MNPYCKLWVDLDSPGARRSRGMPSLFLHFKRTGLLVGLPDEPGVLLSKDGPRAVVLNETDAAGLGLTTDDLADGVALCTDGEDAAGWHCEPIDLVIGPVLAEIGTPGYRRALEAAQAHRARRNTSRPRISPLPMDGTVLVWVRDPWRHDAALREIAALARPRRSRVILAAIGELPETARHATEERAAIARMLEQAAHYFAGMVAATEIALSGEPIESLAAMTRSYGAQAIVLPEERKNASLHAIAGELRTRTGVRVLELPLSISEVEAHPAA